MDKMARNSLAGAVLLTFLAPLPAAAGDNVTGPDRAFLAFQAENDLFANAANTDRHYTNGLQISWLSAPRKLPRWLDFFARLSELGTGARAGPPSHRFGAALGHSIFTPDDTQATAPIPDDRPYAAWLHLALTAQTVRQPASGGALQDKWTLDLGVVGPAAFGEQVQNNWHRLIGADKARGWDNQIRNEPGINLTFERAWRAPALEPTPLLGLQADAIPYGVVALGNVQTFAGAGAIVRLGPDLAADFGPTRIYPGTGGSEWFSPADGFSWYVFAGGEARLVGRDIFLDGNTFRDSPSIDKKPLVADLKLGAVFTIHDVRLSATHVFRTKEFDGQPKPDQFGSLTLSLAL